MLQFFVTSDAPQLVLDNQLDILLDLVVIVQNSLLHAVVAIRILEVVDDGNRLIMAFLSLYLVGVNDNLGMEDLLLYALGEVVGKRYTMVRFRLNMLVESRIRGNVYVRFGGEFLKTSHSNMERRWELSLLKETVKIYEQGKKYYDALKSVNNLVKDARKEQQTILMVGDITDIYIIIKLMFIKI